MFILRRCDENCRKTSIKIVQGVSVEIFGRPDQVGVKARRAPQDDRVLRHLNSIKIAAREKSGLPREFRDLTKYIQTLR